MIAICSQRARQDAELAAGNGLAMRVARAESQPKSSRWPRKIRDREWIKLGIISVGKGSCAHEVVLAGDRGPGPVRRLPVRVDDLREVNIENLRMKAKEGLHTSKLNSRVVQRTLKYGSGMDG